jgi:hypothetical protein
MKMKFRIALSAVLLSAVTMMPLMSPAQEVENNGIRQGELALMLVEVLGFSRFLPARPTEQQAIAILLENGIEPQGGWKPDAPVYAPDLAVIIVKALGLQDEVEDQDNPQSWIDYLVSIGVPIDTVGIAVAGVSPLVEGIAPGAVGDAGDVDPLTRRTVFGLPDETESGTDVAIEIFPEVFVPLTPAEVVQVITSIPDVPPTPTPVTPD